MPQPSEHGDAGRPLASGEGAEIAEDMRAFSAASRVALLYAMLTGEQTVEELATVVGQAPAAVSQQLRILSALRFVRTTRSGRYVSYRLHDHHVADLLSAVRHHHEHLRGFEADQAPRRAREDRAVMH